MQRLADELAAAGLVEFIDNPRHQRSKLVRLTSKGNARYRELSARFLAIAATMGIGLTEADIRRSTEMLRRLSDEVKGRSERLPRSTRLAAPVRVVRSCAHVGTACSHHVPRRQPVSPFR